MNAHRFVIVLDTASLAPDAFAAYAHDVAGVLFTNVAPIDIDSVAVARYSYADVPVAFDAHPADVLAYCDANDCDPDVIIPLEIALYRD